MNDKFLVEFDGSKWYAISADTGEIMSNGYDSQYDCFSDFVVKNTGPRIETCRHVVKILGLSGFSRDKYVCSLDADKFGSDARFGIDINRCKTCEYCSRLIHFGSNVFKSYCTYPRPCRSSDDWPSDKPGDPVGPVPIEFL